MLKANPSMPTATPPISRPLTIWTWSAHRILICIHLICFFSNSIKVCCISLQSCNYIIHYVTLYLQINYTLKVNTVYLKPLFVLTLHRPKNWKVIAVGDSIRCSRACLPETRPVPSNVNNRAATLASNSCHFPAIHC